MREYFFSKKINLYCFLHTFFAFAHNVSMKELEKLRRKFKSNTDPLGSYTGNALDGEEPTQDADDL